jgi:hypothetical protein
LPEVSEEEVRYWFAGPDRKREERDSDVAGRTLGIQVGSTWWGYSPQMGAITNAGDESQGHGIIGHSTDLMLDPAPLLGLLDFEITGQAEQAGRPVIQVRCRPRERNNRHDAFILHTIGLGADAYSLHVDAERGVLLRTEAELNGLPMLVCEAVEIIFDKTLDTKLFQFSSPDGQEPSRLEVVLPRPMQVPLHQAVAAVPFRVYSLPRPPTGWELRVTLRQGSQRPASDPLVLLRYQTEDAASQLNVAQTSATAVDAHRVDGNWIEHDGLQMAVRHRSDTWPQAQLSMELDDTLITMNSDTLTAEDLIDFARRLKPASTNPPPPI